EPRQSVASARLVFHGQTTTCWASAARLPGVAAVTESVYYIQADGQCSRGLYDIAAHYSELTSWEEAVNLWRHDSLFGLLGAAHSGSHVIRSLALHRESSENAKTL